MDKRIISGVAMVAAAGLIGGCATTHKKDDLEAQNLRNQVQSLQADVQSRDQEITNLRQALLTKMQQEPSQSAPTVTESKDRPTVKQIQAALKAAGYNPGAVDGRMGRQTRDAIKSFQKANGLRPDGKVGKETWILMRKHLESKVK